ncbi:hypothetical protein LTR56_022157 [Elasticomyces elasticus]|nr:hypothetical protein LTR56_022157 [Elasticomyces elasticus]KAK3628614.1 hypothetical protein LTR22_022299 [Elasticomyces elasticus]KAK5754611.1 hypothetical protein LTS12_015335 [Elasticomyces elasticus]
MATTVLVVFAFAAFTAAQTCPESDGTVFSPDARARFMIECDIDHAGGDVGLQFVDDFRSCILTCHQTPGCVDVSLSGNACYLKRGVGSRVVQPGIWGARLITSSTPDNGTVVPAPPPSCPESNGTIFVGNSGGRFIIECNTDYAFGDFAQSKVGSFEECIQICDATPDCIDVSNTGGAGGCYLKNSLGEPSYNENVWGARMLDPPENTTTSAAAPSGTERVVDATAVKSSRLSCPGGNGAVYVASSGDNYVIECDTDYSGGNMGSIKATSFEECIESCDSQLTCVDVSLSGGQPAKSELNAYVPSPGIWNARLVTASVPAPPNDTSASPIASASPVADSSTALANITCPEANQTSYTTTNGQSYLVQCSTDHRGGNLRMVDVHTAEFWLPACIEACGSDSACVDVTLSGSACYLKDSSEDGNPAEGISSARLINATIPDASLPPADPSSPTAVAAPPAAPFVAAFEYYACYTDKIQNRTLQDGFLFATNTSSMTLEACAAFCGKFEYFGVEWVLTFAIQ